MGDPRHTAGDPDQIKAGESKIKSYLDKHPLLAGRLYYSSLDMQRRKQVQGDQVSCPRPHSRSRTVERGDWEDLGFKIQLL